MASNSGRPSPPSRISSQRLASLVSGGVAPECDPHEPREAPELVPPAAVRVARTLCTAPTPPRPRTQSQLRAPLTRESPRPLPSRVRRPPPRALGSLLRPPRKHAPYGGFDPVAKCRASDSSTGDPGAGHRDLSRLSEGGGDIARLCLRARPPPGRISPAPPALCPSSASNSSPSHVFRREKLDRTREQVDLCGPVPSINSPALPRPPGARQPAAPARGRLVHRTELGPIAVGLLQVVAEDLLVLAPSACWPPASSQPANARGARPEAPSPSPRRRRPGRGRGRSGSRRRPRTPPDQVG